MRGKGTAFLGNKLREQIGLSSRNQFFNLFSRNFAVQNVLADAEGAGFLLRDRVFAGVGAIKHVNLAFLTNWTKSERFVLRGVDLDRLIVTVLAEVEGRFEIFTELNRCVELATNSAPETFERTDLFFGQKFYQLRTFEQSSGHRFPDN